MIYKNALKNICKNIFKTSLAVVVGVSAISNGQSLAASVTYNFLVNDLDGSLAGQTYYGSFSFDDLYLTGHGRETIKDVGENLSFSFDFLGDHYDETNDPYERTQVSFLNGRPQSIYFRGNYDTYPTIPYTFGFTATNTDENGNFFPVEFYYLIDGINGSAGNGNVVFLDNGNGNNQSVPEPGSIFGVSAIALTVAASKKVNRKIKLQ
jgi:hypothetical protein